MSSASIYIDKIKGIWNHDGFQRYFQNTGWMFGGRMFALIISFVVGIYMARYLGPANYGLLNYVISFVGLFSFLVSFGIDGIVSREIIKDHSKKDELVGTAFYIKIFGSLLAIVSIFIISLFTTKDIFTLGLIWIFSLNFIPQSFNILESYFQSQVLAKNIVRAQFISNIISALLKILCIFLGKGIFWLILIYIFETILYSGILLFTFRKFGNHIRKWGFNKKLAISLIKDSWPLMLSGVAIGIYMKLDQVMIKNMLGNEQAGIYAVVVKLSEVWYFIPSIICASTFPAIVNALKTNISVFESRMKRLYFFMFWLSLIIASTITVFSYLIIKILFGNQYLGAVTSLQIYVWAGVAVSLGIVSSQYLMTNNLNKIFFYETISGAILNIILNIILIPRMGISGAALATLFSYTLSTFGIFFFKKTRGHGFLILRSIINFK